MNKVQLKMKTGETCKTFLHKAFLFFPTDYKRTQITKYAIEESDTVFMPKLTIRTNFEYKEREREGWPGVGGGGIISSCKQNLGKV